jgi:hypothetical protein
MLSRFNQMGGSLHLSGHCGFLLLTAALRALPVGTAGFRDAGDIGSELAR